MTRRRASRRISTLFTFKLFWSLFLVSLLSVLSLLCLIFSLTYTHLANTHIITTLIAHAMTSRKRSSREDVFDDGAYSQSKKTKISSSSSSTQHEGSSSKIDANGDRYWEISKMRRVTVSSFREKMMVSVREYYEKDGQELPGKKVRHVSSPVGLYWVLMGK